MRNLKPRRRHKRRVRVLTHEAEAELNRAGKKWKTDVTRIAWRSSRKGPADLGDVQRAVDGFYRPHHSKPQARQTSRYIELLMGVGIALSAFQATTLLVPDILRLPLAMQAALWVLPGAVIGSILVFAITSYARRPARTA